MSLPSCIFSILSQIHFFFFPPVVLVQNPVFIPDAVSFLVDLKMLLLILFCFSCFKVHSFLFLFFFNELSAFTPTPNFHNPHENIRLHLDTLVFIVACLATENNSIVIEFAGISL